MKLVQQLDQIDRFIKRNTLAASTSTSKSLLSSKRSTPSLSNYKDTQTEPPYIIWRVPNLDIFFRCLRGSSSQQLNTSWRRETAIPQSVFYCDAEKLFSTVTITDAIYTVALKMLQDRYQNNRMILCAHLNGIVVQKPLTLETASDLRELLETV